MRGVSVYKMTGSGNDFVMVDARVSPPDEWAAADIQAVCARGTGIGADGLVLLGPGSAPGAVRMIYFNSDGSRAALCGNAALCSTRLAVHTGLASGPGVVLETDAGAYESRCGADEDRAELHLAPVALPDAIPAVRLEPGEDRAVLTSVGVPHLIVLVSDLERVAVAQRGRVLRRDPALGAEGANVNFVAAAGSNGHWQMRTYERGVEAETLACGTGAVAAGCALDHWKLAELPVTLETRSGGRLEVKARRTKAGQYGDVWLVGEARLVFRGVII